MRTDPPDTSPFNDAKKYLIPRALLVRIYTTDVLFYLTYVLLSPYKSSLESSVTQGLGGICTLFIHWYI